MKLKTALLLAESLFTLGILFLVVYSYILNLPISKNVFFAFILYPFSILAAVLMFSYYISIKFGKSIFAYGLVLGLAISLAILAVRIIPPLLSLGLSIYLANRALLLSETKAIKDLKANLVADHLVSFQIASLVFLILAKEYTHIFESTYPKVSPILFMVILVWYLFTCLYQFRTLYTYFRKWSRSE